MSPTRRSSSGSLHRTVEWAGRLDIVVNNAGVSVVNSPFQDADEFETSWAQTVDVNLTAHARLVRLALPHLLESHAGTHREHRLDRGVGQHGRVWARTPQPRPASSG